MAYAEGTEVPVERSRAEVERLLTRYGASEFMSGWSVNGRAMIAFRAKGPLRPIRAADAREGRQQSAPTSAPLSLPGLLSQRFIRDGRGAARTLLQPIPVSTASSFDLMTRAATFEHEFLAHIVMPGGPDGGRDGFAAHRRGLRDGHDAPAPAGGSGMSREALAAAARAALRGHDGGSPSPLIPEQLPLALTEPPRRPRAAALRSYFPAAAETVPEALVGEARAVRQEETLLAWFRLRPGRRFTPSEVHALAGLRCELTSVRRALTNLSDAGLLVHYERDRVPSPRGGRESKWSLA